ncbi:urease accessory protein UreD [Streptomyces sp. NPDC089919]|uniref:urease accessory protein UreD n=1 Tax=Streptomyces sp. NPDC089919 TaxID=3155188 RepID=UPI0034394F30
MSAPTATRSGPPAPPAVPVTAYPPAPADRLGPGHYEPEHVPAAVARHAARPHMLGVGRPGKVGLLELGYARVGARTELVHHFQKSPLQIMRPLYFDPHRPDLPLTFLMSTGGGVLQADRLRTDLHVGAGAAALLTTQAATKVYRMEHDYATAQTFLTAGPDSYVEYLPDPVIPFVGSRFYQRTTVTADPSATVLLSETVLAGRLARGERHAYDVFASDLEVLLPDGRPVAVDTVRLEPGAHRVDGPAVMAGHAVTAAFFALTPLAPAGELAGLLHAALPAHPSVRAGVSVLPDARGVWVRLLGPAAEPVAGALRTAWDCVRRRLIGVPAPHLRKS